MSDRGEDIDHIKYELAQLKEAFADLVDAVKVHEGESKEDAKKRVSQFLFGAE